MAKKKKKSGGSGQPKPMSDARFLTEKARSLPIYSCYISEDWRQSGMAEVIVARERGNGKLCVGIFLCDLWCLGVKDAFGIFNISKEDFERKLIEGEKFSSIKECDYILAHNIIYGSEAFAADADIPPAPGFALWSHILDEDTDDVPLMDIEFGDNGKYHLVADRGTREARYAPQLKALLGDDFVWTLRFGEDPIEEEDYDNEDATHTREEMRKWFREFEKGYEKTRREDLRHPVEPYSYRHPDYPATLDVKHRFIAEEFSKPANLNSIPGEVISRILELPEEEVLSDLNAIVLYAIGRTWKGIDDETIEWDDDGSLLHALVFLTQLGNPAGLETVMEVMRQNDEFISYHLSDFADDLLLQALYATGRTRPEVLEEFLSHPGYSQYRRTNVSEVLSFIAQQEPRRREEIIAIFRRYLDFMHENMPTQNGCTGYVAAAVISDLIDLKAKELLPEIKRLYDSGYVNLNICGDYKDVLEALDRDRTTYPIPQFKGIQAFYDGITPVSED